MTSVFDVLAADDRDERLAFRKAAAVTQARVENVYGTWVRQDPSRLSFVEDEIRAIAAQAAEEFGVKDSTTIADVVLGAGWEKDADCGKDHDKKGDDNGEDEPKSDKLPWNKKDDGDDDDDDKKESSIHEARKPKMCPFHKDVVDISLNAGDPTAGYTAMAQHWGGDRHCEGGGYEGGKCNFKAPMTTQAFWDQKAEKAEEKRQQRLEQEQENVVDLPVDSEPSEAIDDASPVEEISTEPQGAEVIDFPVEPSAVGEGYEHAEPLAVAAKVAGEENYTCQRCEDGVHCGDCRCCGKEIRKSEASAKVAGNGNCNNCGKPLGNDTGTYCKSCGEKKDSSTKTSEDIQALIQKYVAQGIPYDKAAQLAQQQIRIGPLPTGAPNVTGQPTGPSNGPQVFAADGNTDLGGPSPKIDKRLWTPKTVPALKGLDEASPNPSERIDPTQAIEYEKSNKSELQNIDGGNTKRESLPSSDNAGFSSGGEIPPHTDTFGNKNQADPVTASAEDPEKNPIIEYFLSEDEIAQAITSYKK